jgi:colanic acid/amylovoran biosynthesis glycosyltransferase
MSRFPRLSETFVLLEILALEDRGVHVEVFPLLRGDSDSHPEAEPLAARAHYFPFFSGPILASQFHYLVRHPRRYLGALWTAVSGTAGSLNFFAGAIAIFPKVAHAARVMSDLGVTHVHCHFANHPALAGLIIHRLTGIPYSFTAHGSDLHVDRRMLCEKVEAASFVATISGYNQDLISEECGPAARSKVHVVHCGVDVELFRPSTPNGDGDASAGDGEISILSVGTLREVKGHRHLIAACAALVADGVPFRCTIVGEGEERSRLERQIADAALSDRVLLAGAMDRHRVLALLRSMEVFVAPSSPDSEGRREGIPVVLMEAMACGLPVVSSRISGIPELVEDGVSGLLVEPGDVGGLAAVITRLAGDRALRERLGRAARARVVESFNIEKSVCRLEDLFSEAAAR